MRLTISKHGHIATTRKKKKKPKSLHKVSLVNTREYRSPLFRFSHPHRVRLSGKNRPPNTTTAESFVFPQRMYYHNNIGIGIRVYNIVVCVRPRNRLTVCWLLNPFRPNDGNKWTARANPRWARSPAAASAADGFTAILFAAGVIWKKRLLYTRTHIIHIFIINKRIVPTGNNNVCIYSVICIYKYDCTCVYASRRETLIPLLPPLRDSTAAAGVHRSWEHNHTRSSRRRRRRRRVFSRPRN